MAKISLRGDAQDVDQIQTFTLSAVATSGVYTVLINAKSVSYTATNTDTNATAAAALLALLAASNIPEFQEVAWSVLSNVISGQSKAAGMPFTATVSASGGVTFTTTVTQTPTGKNWIDSVNNWTLGRVPAGECQPPVQATASATGGGALVAGVTYYWVIAATNPLGETAKSNERSLAITGTAQTANLAWANVVGATGYRVYRSVTTGVFTPTALAAIVTGGSVLAYADAGGATAAGATLVTGTALGDDVYLKQTNVSLLYGTDLNNIVWNSLHVDATYVGDGGLSDIADTGYYQYRNTHLKISPKKIFFGENATSGGVGPGLFRVDYGANVTQWFVYATGNPKTQGLPALYIKGTGASSIVLQQGYVGLNVNPGETSNFSTLFEIGYRTSPASDVNLTIGAGCTLNAITQLGGVVYCNANVTTLTTTADSQGKFYLLGSATMGTFVIDGGVYYHQSDGTITAGTVNPGGVFDHTQDVRAFTITNLTLRDGCTFLDPAHTIVYTNPVLIDGSIGNMKVDFGSTYHINFS